MRISDWSSDVCSSDLADADEASLDAATSAAALEQQRAFLDARVAACANIRTTAQLEDFVIAAELAASGRVTNTCRRGESPLALCLERNALGKIMFVPPPAHFHPSLSRCSTPAPAPPGRTPPCPAPPGSPSCDDQWWLTVP